MYLNLLAGRERFFGAAVVAFAFAMLTGVSPAQAQQEGAITGTVIDAESAEPLSGAQVFIEGTEFGTLTDQDGAYRLEGVPAGEAQVSVQLIGFQRTTQAVNVQAGQTATLNFEIGVSAVELDRVVVNVVTGVDQRRRMIGTNESVINAEEINQGPVNTFQNLLQGRSEGVVLSEASGTSGTGNRIRIRGANSLSLSNEPLIFIDGVRTSGGSNELQAGAVGGQETSRLNDLNPQDIASIQVLKGPAASAQYGANAANGVILISTKRGDVSGTSWHFYAEGGALEDETDYPVNVMSFQNIDPDNATGFGGEDPSYFLELPGGVANSPDGTDEIFNSAALAVCPNYEAALGACTQDITHSFNTMTDSRTTPLSTGDRQNYGGNVSSAGEDYTFYLSGNYEQENGVFENNFVESVGLRGNISANLRDDLDVNFHTKYVNSDVGLPQNDNNIFSPIINGIMGAPTFIPGDGGLFTSDEFAGTQASYANYGFYTLPSESALLTGVEENDRFIGGVSGNYRPLDWLSANFNLGADFNNLDNPFTLQQGMGSIGGEFTLGFRNRATGQRTVLTGNASAEARFDINESLTASTVVGGAYDEERTEFTECFGAQLVPGLDSCDATSSLFAVSEVFTQVRTVAGFIQEQLSFGDRLFLTASVRADDNSAFGGDIGAQFYPSVNASWVMSEEDFFPEADFLSELRLRGAYGVSGVRPGFRDARTLFSPVTVTVGGGNEPAVSIEETGNPELDPERVREFEGGFDASLLSDRLSVAFTYYDKKSTDALIARPLPPSFGLTGDVFDNLGAISNRGIEVGLDGVVLNRDDVGLDLGFQVTTVSNEILELGEGVEPIILNRGEQRHKEGFPAGAYHQPQYEFEDANGDGLLSQDEVRIATDSAVFVDESIPTWTTSLSANLRLFDVVQLSSLVEARGGHSQLDGTESFRCATPVTDAIKPSGCPANGDPNASLDEQARFIADRFLGTAVGFIHEADFLKVREVSLRLNAPSSLGDAVGLLRNSSLTVSGRNLATITDYPGLDPEINESGGSTNFTQNEFNTQPPVRILSARLDLRF